MTKIDYYSDRKEELNDFINIITSFNECVLIYETCPNYGITAFFHRIQWALQTTPNTLCFCAELTPKQCSPINEFVKNISVKNDSMYNSLQLFTDEHYGKYETTLFESLAKDIPYLGETISSIFTEKKAIPVYSGYYPDILKEMFLQLLSHLASNKKVIVFVDGIEYLDKSTFYDIINISKIPNVFLVLSFSNANDNTEKLSLELEIRHKVLHRTFNSPSIECIQELGEVYEKDISVLEAQKIKGNSNNNIRRIISEIKNTFQNVNDSDKILCKYIYIILILLADEIEFGELTAILQNLLVCNIYSKKDIEKAVEELSNMGVICSVFASEHLKYYIRINNKNNSELSTRFLDNKVDVLLCKNALFVYFKNKDNHTINQLQLLFDISSEFNYSDSENWAQKVIIKSLQQGFNINNSLINAISSSKKQYTKFIYSICLMRNQKYKKAKDILKDLYKLYPLNREIKKLYAVSLNRCRFHKEAETLFNELIATCTDANEKLVLLSYLIVNYIHDGNENMAKTIFLDNYTDNDLSQNSYWGYFLRNSATIFDNSKAIDLWSEAIASFENNNDVFGEYSTKCNMARYYLRTDIEFARDILLSAFEGIMQYGVEKLNIVANNLGIVSLFCHNRKDAEKYLNLAIRFSKTIMPKAYATMNMCCLLISQDKTEEAKKILENLNEQIKQSKLPRLKVKFDLTMSAISYVLKDYEKAKEHLRKANKNTTKFKKTIDELQFRIDNKIEYLASDWKKIFSPCFLEYWIVDPLIIISNKPLPLETVDEDFFN